ncbi:OsmC family protein [Nitrosococcus halophilus Nc 4]|uniref:OsmC family protein n=1 Tax=Nitrosococcus halophilus (strain Nc4) TaxID=472759 RepID=D5BYL2_NITHN|nr:alpha/beta hydrolase [Nitrosococcus halophilus]ADE16000.1 OsmC family protein [Nitrosococcus halophilus Nc 4]
MPAVKVERVNFSGHQGDELAARLDRPQDIPLGYALFAHCFTCSKDFFAVTRISNTLAERGIAVLRFDFTGLGSSGGDFANTNFSSNIADLVQAASFMEEHYQAPRLLIGHSLGGAAVLAAAEEIPEILAVATISAPSDPAHVSHLFAKSISELEEQGEIEVQLAGRSFRIQKQFLDDIAEHNLLQKVKSLRKALMIFHGPKDTIVGIEHARHIFEAAKHPKSFVSLDDADHLLSRKKDAIFVANVLAAWAERYLT